MKSPSALVAHLNANLPAAWAVCALPKPLRRRAYGAARAENRTACGQWSANATDPPPDPRAPRPRRGFTTRPARRSGS